MTYYIQEVQRIKETCFSNEAQLDMAVNTKRYIDRHFEEALNLDLLAHLAFTSKFHLIRIFKKYYGLTPRQYLINKRIEQAKQILRGGGTVSESCYTVGYNSLHSFSTLFKSKTGQSPSDYRRATFDKASR